MKIHYPILLVEDEPNDVFFFQRAMKKAEVANPLHAAIDGQAAIDYLTNQGEFADRQKFVTPRLIVLDLNLPRKHGFEVLRWLRQNPELNTLVVVVLTSSKSENDMRQAYQLGANSYLVKPSDTDKLVEMARLIKEYWLNINQLPLSRGSHLHY